MSEVSNITIIVAGIVIVSIHIVIAFTTRFLFGVLMAFYTIGFAIMAIVFLQKKEQCTSSLEHEVGIYTSIFMIIVNVVMVIYIIYTVAKPAVPYYNSNYRSSSRY